MKKLVAIFIATFVTVFACYAQLSVSTGIDSKYLGQGYGIFHQDPMMATTVNYDFQNGVYIGLWHGIGLDDAKFSSNSADEMDWTLGWKKKNETGEINLSFTYIDGVDLFHFGKEDVLLPSVGINTVLKKDFVFYINILGIITLNKTQDLSGAWCQVGGKYNYTFLENWTWSNGTELLYDSGALSFSDGYLLLYKTSVSKTFFGVGVSPYYKHSFNVLKFGDDARGGDNVFGVSFNYTFK